MKARKVCLYAQLLLLLVIAFQMPASGIVYVSQSGLILNGGTSWADSVPSIQQGVTLAAGSGAPQPAFGGAIFYQNLGTISIVNNTFVGNAVTPQAGLITDIDRPYGLGGAIYVTGSTTAKIVNNIIAKTRGTSVVNDGMVVTFNYNLLWHNAGGDIFGFNFPPTILDKNIMKDPQFLKGDSLFHITFGSPAKDSGLNGGAPAFDIDGETRPFNLIVDIGADEFVDTDLDGGADVDPRETSPLAILLPETDLDLDGVYTPYDNCPTNANAHQVDSNGDGIGDVCEGIPEVFYVDAGVVSSGNGLSWLTAFKTIQEGIDAADLHNQTNVDGATPWTGVNPEVWVKAGVYNENPLIWHGVQVYGGFNGAELPPSLDPNVLSGRTSLVNVTEINGGALWSTVVIAHLPQDRYLTGTTKTIYDALTPTIDGFLIANGKAEIGGGVSVYKETANVSANRVNSNIAALGGGVYLFKSYGTVGDGIGPALGNLLTGDTTVNSNTATDPISYAGYGGGIYAERGSPLIFGNIIEGITAESSGAIVAAVFSDGFYIEDAERTNGINVIMQNPSVSEGQVVNVTGVVTTLNDERQLINAGVDKLLGAAMLLEPVGMPNSAVGGGPVGKWTSGVTKGVGLSNVGLLVRTWGKVTVSGTSPYPYFTIDDGSGVGVKVRVPSGSSLPAVGSVVSAAGISTIEPGANNYRGRLIRARRASDITPR